MKDSKKPKVIQHRQPILDKEALIIERSAARSLLKKDIDIEEALDNSEMEKINRDKVTLIKDYYFVQCPKCKKYSLLTAGTTRICGKTLKDAEWINGKFFGKKICERNLKVPMARTEEFIAGNWQDKLLVAQVEEYDEDSEFWSNLSYHNSTEEAIAAVEGKDPEKFRVVVL